MFHSCTRECPLIELSMFNCPVDGLCLGAGLYPRVVATANRRVPRCQYMETHCYRQRHTPVQEVLVWACMFSGHIHWCGNECSQTEETHDGDLVCLLTGRIFRGLVYGKAKRAPPGAVYRDSRRADSFKTEYIRGSVNNQSFTEHHAFVTKGIRSKPGEVLRREMFTDCIIFANDYLTRRVRDAGGPRRQQRDSEVQEALAAAVRGRLRSGKFSAMELVHIAAAVRSRQPVPFIIRLSPQRIRKHASLVATRIVVLIGLMRTQVPGASQYMAGLSLKELFISGLELCRIGISLRGFTFLSPDPILMLVSSGADDIGEYWNTHVDQKKVRGGVRKYPRRLCELFQEAVSEHGVHPEYLRVDELATSVENIPSDAFDNWV